MKRAHIYRLALSAVGYAVLTEKKKKGAVSTTVKLKLGGVGAEGKAAGEVEQTLHAVTVDLKNSTEVAHLISKLGVSPWLVLDDFESLGNGTKRKLLRDFKFFVDTSSVRVVILGTWSQSDYLEEIEPLVAGKFSYVMVPTWSDAELRRAVEQWIKTSPNLQLSEDDLVSCLKLAGGDVSLFHSLVNASERLGVDSKTSNSLLWRETMIVSRFRRSLHRKLKNLFAQRDIYISYLYVMITTGDAPNPKYQQVTDPVVAGYKKTRIDWAQNESSRRRDEMWIDLDGNPEFIQAISGKIAKDQIEILSVVLIKLCRAARDGLTSISLTALAAQTRDLLGSVPISFDESILKGVIARLNDVQRREQIIPPMLSVDDTSDTIEIVDRRLFLYFQTVDESDLAELINSVSPGYRVNPRSRNNVSQGISQPEASALIARAIAEKKGTPEETELFVDDNDEEVDDGDEDERW